MLKNYKRWLPTREVIQKDRYLQYFGRILHEPDLWHLHRHGVAKAFLIGLFVMYLPIPFQMLIVCILGVIIRANLLISVALTWISNPLTMAPIIYMSYKVGSWVLQTPPPPEKFSLTPQILIKHLTLFWKPFLVGNLICALITAIAGYCIVQLLWGIVGRKLNK